MSEESSGAHTLASQGLITFLGNIVGKSLGFAFVAVATRLVTPAEYGLFTLGLSIVMFSQGFTSLSIYRSIDYFVPKHLSDSNFGMAKKTLQNTYFIGILSSVVGAGLFFLFRNNIAVLFNEPTISIIIAYFVLLIPLQTVFRSLLSTFNSLKKMKYRITMRDFLNPLIRILGSIGLVFSGFGVLGLVGGYVFGVLAAVLVGFILLLYEAEWVRNAKPKPVSNKRILRYSLPLVLAGVIYSLVGQIDYFLIGYFLNATAVAEYRVAYLLSGNLLIILTAVTPVFKPMVAENKSNPSFLENQYGLATRWITILTLPLAITLILAPEEYLSILFTERYSVAGHAVVALTIGYLLNASFGPEGMILEGLGYTRLTLINTLVLVGVNSILNVILIPQYGILGAGIATGTALTIAGVVGVVEIYYLRSISNLNMNLVKAWVAALFPIILGLMSTKYLHNIQRALLLPIIIVLSYTISLHYLSVFSDEDREVAEMLDNKLGYPIIQSIVSDPKIKFWPKK